MKTCLLLLWGGIVQSVHCNCNHLLIYCASHLSFNHSLFIHQDSLLWLQKRYLVAKRGKPWREMSVNFVYRYLFSYFYCIFNMP
jgi:hypothetical protein